MSDAPEQFDDDFEEVPGDEEDTYSDKATWPVNGTLAWGDVNFAGDFDWHGFYVPATATCSIETVLRGTLTDSYIDLYGPNSTTTYVKKLVKNQPTPSKKLELHRETLMRLEEVDLNKAGGAQYDWPPIMGVSDSEC